MTRAKLFTTAAALAISAGAAHADFSLNILHINDFHSRFGPINKYDSNCNAEDNAEGKCFGGAARIKTKVDEMRGAIAADGGNVLTLIAGDMFQGSLFYTTYKGVAEAEFLETMGVDAMVLGNHEFDDGPEGLIEFLDIVKFPVIGGNVDTSGNNALAGRVPNTVVLEVAGEKIGIVAALTTDTLEIAAPGPTIKITEEIASVQAQVDTLTAEGVNKIILLSHVGFGKDIELAQAVTGIDAVVGGHTNTYLSATDAKRAGPYPTWVNGPDGALVPVVHAYAFGKYLGNLELEFDAAGNVTHAGGDTIVLDASVAEDEALVARIAELEGPIQEKMGEVVAQSAATIDGERANCRARECEMGNLVADAMLDRVKSQGVTIAIQNGGGVRASIDAGDVTMGEVLTVLPFQNTLATFQIDGAGIMAALENGVSQVEDGAGRFPQVAGLKFTWDPASAPGSRIKSVMVDEGDGFVALDEAKLYSVVTNNYVRGGGDGYKIFRDGLNAYDYGPGLEVVVAEFLAAQGPYTPYVDGRIASE